MQADASKLTHKSKWNQSYIKMYVFTKSYEVVSKYSIGLECSRNSTKQKSYIIIRWMVTKDEVNKNSGRNLTYWTPNDNQYQALQNNTLTHH